MSKDIIKVKNAKEKKESNEFIRVSKSDISYYRKWVDKDFKEEQTVIYLCSGKQLIVKGSPEEIDKQY